MKFQKHFFTKIIHSKDYVLLLVLANVIQLQVF